MASALRRGCLLGLACMAFAACGTPPPARPAADLGLAADWPQRRALLQQLRHYGCSGRVAVSATGQGFNAQFNWQLAGDAAELNLRGPLGAGGLIVRTRGEQIDLQATDGRALDGAAARAELERALGTALPVAPLGYWLLGVPQPGDAATESQAAAAQPAQLASLEQQGWRVDYQAHAGVPRQMTLTRGATRVRLVIERWDWQSP